MAAMAASAADGPPAVALGLGGRVCIAASVATDVVVDLFGTFPAGASGYQTVVPTRLYASRPGHASGSLAALPAANCDHDTGPVAGWLNNRHVWVQAYGNHAPVVPGPPSDASLNLFGYDPATAIADVVWFAGWPEATVPGAIDGVGVISFRNGAVVARTLLAEDGADDIIVEDLADLDVFPNYGYRPVAQYQMKPAGDLGLLNLSSCHVAPPGG